MLHYYKNVFDFKNEYIISLTIGGGNSKNYNALNIKYLFLMTADQDKMANGTL
jgi:hypothetical protein